MISHADSKALIALASATVTDLLQSYAVPYAALAATALGLGLEQLRARRMETARDIAIRAIGKGAAHKLAVTDADEFVAVSHRYMRAAIEGTARLNLTLMANVMAGQLQESALYASDFQRYADLLATMSREEVIYMGMLAAKSEEAAATSDGEDKSQDIAIEVQKALVPSETFASIGELTTCETALQRTGLIRYMTWTADGGQILAISQHGRRVAKLARFDEAIRDGIRLKP